MSSDDRSWVEAGGWSEVASGLRLFMAYVITNLSFTVIVLIATFAVAASGVSGGGAEHLASTLSSVVTIARVSAFASIGIALFGLFAIWRYAKVAPQSGARGTAQAAFYFGVASLGLSLVTLARLMAESDLDEMAAVNLWDILAKVLGVIQFFCLLSSMRTLAGYIGAFDLQQLAGTTMLLAGITIALAVLTQLLARGRAMAPTALIGLATLGIGIWCLVYLIMLLVRLARAVSRDAQLPGTFA